MPRVCSCFTSGRSNNACAVNAQVVPEFIFSAPPKDQSGRRDRFRTMEINWPLSLGVLASICSISSFVPQAVKTIRTGDTKSLSTTMYILTVVAFALWTSYGFVLGSWPIVITNAICLVLSASILVVKVRSSRR